MILETIRLIRRRLEDGTNGVNALLPTIARDGADPQPASIVTIVDETQDAVAARRWMPQLAAQCPALGVYLASDATFNPNPRPGSSGTRDGSVTVLIRYGNRTATSATGNRDAHYTLRAVLQSLRTLNDADQQGAARTLNGISLFYFEDARQVPLYEEMDDVVVTGGLLVTVRVRDTQP